MQVILIWAVFDFTAGVVLCNFGRDVVNCSHIFFFGEYYLIGFASILPASRIESNVLNISREECPRSDECDHGWHYNALALHPWWYIYPNGDILLEYRSQSHGFHHEWRHNVPVWYIKLQEPQLNQKKEPTDAICVFRLFSTVSVSSSKGYQKSTVANLGLKMSLLGPCLPRPKKKKKKRP